MTKPCCASAAYSSIFPMRPACRCNATSASSNARPLPASADSTETDPLQKQRPACNAGLFRWRTGEAAPPRSAAGASQLPGGLQAAHAQVFQVEVIVQAIDRAFVAHAAFLDATKRCDFRRDNAFVDANHAILQCTRHAEATRQIFGVDICRETELG